MAYLLTAIMTGGVAAILSLFAGNTLGDIFMNYVIYGHLGMATLALATVASTAVDRRQNSDA
jgi:hypothetical protein